MKVYLACLSSRIKVLKELLEENIIVPYMLESFAYIRPFQTQYIKYTKSFLLDSGAFTLLTSKKKINFQVTKHNLKEWIKYSSYKGRF